MDKRMEYIVNIDGESSDELTASVSGWLHLIVYLPAGYVVVSLL